MEDGTCRLGINTYRDRSDVAYWILPEFEFVEPQGLCMTRGHWDFGLGVAGVVHLVTYY